MTDRPEIRFLALSAPLAPTAVMLTGIELHLGAIAERLDRQSSGSIKRAAATADFKGKARTSFEILGASGVDVARMVVLGIGDKKVATSLDWVRLGGAAYSQIINRPAEKARHELILAKRNLSATAGSK